MPTPAYHHNQFILNFKFMYALDGRKLLSNYGSQSEDKNLYLGLNQVPYDKDATKIGRGLCRACITIERAGMYFILIQN